MVKLQIKQDEKPKMSKREIKEAMKEVQKEDYEQFKKDEVLTPEEAQSRIAFLLAQTKEPDLMSELGGEEIKLLSALQTIADETDADILDEFITNFLRMRVSLRRKGRTEIMEIARAGGGTEERMRKGLKSMILGLK